MWSVKALIELLACEAGFEKLSIHPVASIITYVLKNKVVIKIYVIIHINKELVWRNLFLGFQKLIETNKKTIKLVWWVNVSQLLNQMYAALFSSNAVVIAKANSKKGTKVLIIKRIKWNQSYIL